MVFGLISISRLLLVFGVIRCTCSCRIMMYTAGIPLLIMKASMVGRWIGYM